MFFFCTKGYCFILCTCVTKSRKVSGLVLFKRIYKLHEVLNGGVKPTVETYFYRRT